MGNAWETHGKRMGNTWKTWAGLGWPGLAWACLVWAGLALGGSSMTEFLRRAFYNKHNGISMGTTNKKNT
jgi:hypothetical protein